MQFRVLTIALVFGAALTACKPHGDVATNSDKGDARVGALNGADSAASPNVNPQAAANQIQIPDYPPADTNRAPAPAPQAPAR